MHDNQNRGYSLALSSIHDYIEKILAVNSEQDFVSICSSIAEGLDASYFSYGVMWPDDFHHIKLSILSNYQRDWVEEYKNNSYQIVDPRIRDCISSVTPVFWNTQGSYLQNLSKDANSMMQNAHEHSIRSGVTIPFQSFNNIRGVFGIGLNSDSYNDSKSQKHLEYISPYLGYLGSFVHQAMIHIIESEKSTLDNPLTVREKDCLCWAADGKTAFQIASKLYISESTVKFHFKNIMKKLGARNTSQALAIAILKGFIRPELKS